MSTPEVSANRDRVDTLSGLMSAAAIFLAFLCATDLHLTIGGTDVQMRPVRVGVAAVVLALIAAAIGGRHGSWLLPPPLSQVQAGCSA